MNPEHICNNRPASHKLFHFTEREDRLIHLAIQLSIEYMKHYGAGRRPRMLDRSAYL